MVERERKRGRLNYDKLLSIFSRADIITSTILLIRSDRIVSNGGVEVPSTEMHAILLISGAQKWIII